MKRFAPLALIVLALAAVPAAFADDSTPTMPSNPPATQPANGHPMARIQLELLRIRLQLVHLRYQIVCHQQDSDKCTQFTQKVTDRLTKLDGNVQDKLTKLNCTSTTGTDKRCDFLTKLDQKLQDVITNFGSGPSSGAGESGLDNAAGSLTGSTNP